MGIRNGLKKLRSELNYTQKEMADTLNVSFATFNRWEGEKAVPNKISAIAVMSIVDELDVSKECKDYLRNELIPENTQNDSNKIFQHNHTNTEIHQRSSFTTSLNNKCKMDFFENIVRNGRFFFYDSLAELDLKNKKITILNEENFEKQGELEVKNYEETLASFVEHKVADEDKNKVLDFFSVRNLRKEMQNSENSFTSNYESIDSSGQKKKMQLIVYFYDKENEVCLIVKSDVSKYIAQEKDKINKITLALEMAEEATMVKSRFLSRMSHEIRTPMNAIKGMIQIAKDNQNNTAQVIECLDNIDKSSEYLLSIINDILDMSRIENGNTKINDVPFIFGDLLDNIKNIAEPLAKSNGLQYLCICNDKYDKYYMGDRLHIQQAIVNIISNAVKFTNEGGKVRFTIKLDNESDRITTCRFIVEDTGIGISKDFMDRLFLPFEQEDMGETSKYNGTGLGMSITKNIVESMDGKIEVDSYKDIGSTFTITLPLKRLSKTDIIAADNNNSSIDKKDDILLESCRILLVEDHPLNIAVARKLLKRKGAEVHIALNGKEAVDMFFESEPKYYDAILMDIRMPVMDGIEASKRIRASKREDALEVPIIAMTANSLDEDREKTQQAGMNYHLSKPIDKDLLYMVLKNEIKKYKT